MTQRPSRDSSLPDYLEIGNAEVYEDPGSTLPQDSALWRGQKSAYAKQAADSSDTSDTLPAELSASPDADSVRTVSHASAAHESGAAILAGHGKNGRLPQDGPLPKRVLVVDDDLTARLYIRVRLMLRGNVSILEASNAADALNLLQAQPAVDAALLDVDMGERNGFALCRDIRAWVRSQRGTQPKIYIISSRSSVMDKLQAKMAGADAFLTKPPSPKDLAALLKQL